MANEVYLIETNSTMILVNIVCSIIGIVHNTLLLFRVLYDNTINKKSAEKDQVQKKLLYCTIAVISGYIVMNSSFLFVEFNSFHHILGCNMILISIAWYYFVPKYLGWLYQIIRLNIFRNNNIAYSNKYLNIIAISLFVVPISITLLMVLFSIKYYVGNYNHCDLITPLWLGCVCGGIDGVASFFCIYLFYAKMKTLTKQIENNKNMRRISLNALYFVRKFIILACVIVMSTYVLTLFVMYSGLITALMSIDSMINVWCLILYDGRYDKLYQIIFKCIAKRHQYTQSSATSMSIISHSTQDPTTTTKESEKNEMINKYLYGFKQKHEKTISLLLLGPGNSGKSTILKQMHQIYRGSVESNELKNTVSFIRENILEFIQDLVKQNEILKVNNVECQLENEENHQFVTKIASLNLKKSEYLKETVLTPDLAKNISILWNDKGLQETLNIRKKHCIIDNAEYFIENIERIADPKYEANFADFVRVRNRTSGIIESEFQVNIQNDADHKWRFKITDIGGQRTERKKWLSCFSDIHAIIYVMSLAAYNQTLFEDDTQNCYREALDVFDKTMKHKALSTVDVIVFLNKNDLFVPKIKVIPFTVFEPNFDSQSVYDGNAVKEYLRKQYKKRFYAGIECNKSNKSKRKIHFHVTCATDTNQIETVMRVIQFETVRKMMMVGMLM